METRSTVNTWLRKLATFFEIMPREGRLTLLALGATFFHGVSSIYLFSVSHALFLSVYQAADLPLTYIGGAFTVLLVGAAFSRLQSRIPVVTLVVGTLVFLLLTLLACRLWLALGNPKGPAAFLAVWSVAYSTLTYMSIWGLFGRLFDARQAKRLFGLIGSGEFSADIISGFITPLLVSLFGSFNLLLVAGGGLLASICFTVLLSRTPTTRKNAEPEAPAEQAGMSAGAIFRERYPLLLHLLWGLSMLIFYLMDTAFSSQVEIHYSDSADAMTGFLGIFFAVGSAINMLAESLLTGRILGRLGIIKAQYLLPAGVFLGSLLLIGASLPWGRTALIVFCLAVGTKMFDYVMRNAVHDPAFQVLYQPLPRAKRFAVQSSVLTKAEPCAALVSGLILLTGRFYFRIDAINVTLIIMVAVILQITLTVVLKSQYLGALWQALRHRRYGLEPDSPVQDAAGLRLLMGWLRSLEPMEVLHALEVLEKNAPDQLVDQLSDLLGHDDPRVVQAALGVLERRGPSPGFVQVVQRLLLDANRPLDIRIKAAATLAALDEEAAKEILPPLLLDDDRHILKGAAVGLIRHAGLEGSLLAGPMVLELLAAPEPDRRALGLTILGESGVLAYHRHVKAALTDPDPGVRQAALTATASLPHPAMITPLIAHLGRIEGHFLAIKALAALGEQALPELSRLVADQDFSRATILGIFRAVTRMGGAPARNFLAEHCYYPDPAIREIALAQLMRTDHQARDANDRLLIRVSIQREAANVAWLLSCRQAVVGQAELEPMATALDEEYASAFRRILAWLSFLCPPSLMARIHLVLRRDDPEQRAYALEALESLLDERTKRAILPLLEKLSDNERIEMLRKVFPGKTTTPLEVAFEILGQAGSWLGPWTRAVTVFVIGRLGWNEAASVVATLAANGHPLVRETAVWAQKRLGNPDVEAPVC